MANCFPFSKTKSVVCEDGTVAWLNQMDTRSPLNFSTTEDSLNETYATAVDANETQYLSVLESNDDDTLDNMQNITLSNQKLIEENEVLNSESGTENNLNLTESGDQQVVIFNVDGSDEIYGIQLAQDEEGNIHKYQFQFRKTDDGQLEAMPETIQLLANEEEPPLTEEHQETVVELIENQIVNEHFETAVYLHEETDESTQTGLLVPQETGEQFEDNIDNSNMYDEEERVIVSNENQGILLKQENMIHKEIEQEDEQEEDDMGTEGLESDYDEDIVDIKPGLEIEKLKQEYIHGQSEDFDSQNQGSEGAVLENHEEEVLENFNGGYASEADSYSTTEIQNEGDETIVTYQNFEPNSLEEHYEESTETPNNGEPTHYEQLFIEERNLDELNYDGEQSEEGDEANANVLIVEKDQGTNDSENEDYEIVEGLPVTADGEISEDTSSTVYQETEILYSEPEVPIQTIVPRKDKSVPKTTNILKQPTNINKINDAKEKTIVYYMVPNTEQKENVNSLSLKSMNPRSLLKNNVDVKKINDEHIKKLQREKLLERRYARSKEAIQAKMFNNFINKTTIPHAPVRQGRLPRKQEIKPVDTRRDEEIIVQEVMVSSKGFVESISDRLKNLDKLEVTSIVELSDSDEDYEPKNGTKKKKKHRKTKPTNTATSDSDASIIEIHSDDEPNNAESSTYTVKKGRGRPKKNAEDCLKRSRGRDSKSGSGDESSPQKKSRTEESSEVDSDNGKKEINCPHCPKSFPSQNSLSTHIQHHNLENSLRNKKIPATEYKHKCEDCQLTFKNTILLKKHVCNKDSKHNYKCGVCFKTFLGVGIFNIHKKSHLKENLIRSTSTVTISPKKFTPRPSTSTFKLPGTFKCTECSKVCSSQSILAIHEKSHKKFVCTNCNTSFPSRILLDSHVRIKCVKPKSPKDKRLSFKIRKSYVKSPCRASLRGRSINPVKLTYPVVNAKSVARKNTNFIAKNKSVNPELSVTVNPISNRSFKPEFKTNLDVTTSKQINIGASSSVKSNVNTTASTKSTNPMFNHCATPGKNINAGLNSSSMIRTLDIEAQCDSCPNKFSSLTVLFKHKVKVHGLHTPDKRVLEPKRTMLHKPLNLHGGIPANKRLNKAFQGLREKIILKGGPQELGLFGEKPSAIEKSDLSKDCELSEKSELIELVVSEHN